MTCEKASMDRISKQVDNFMVNAVPCVLECVAIGNPPRWRHVLTLVTDIQ